MNPPEDQSRDPRLAFPKPQLHLADPPPPYPSRDRRTRTGPARSNSRRLATLHTENSAGRHPDPATLSPADDDDGTETSPLLPPPRARTNSHSTAHSTQSIAQNVYALFLTENDQGEPGFRDDDASSIGQMSRFRGIRRYFRPMWKASYYLPLFHLLCINFFYSLSAFLFLFVGTLTGTILLVALPLGAVICWFTLIGARAFARGELALQARFHSPLAIGPPMPIFYRHFENRSPLALEGGQSRTRHESSFLRNTFAMFTDVASYQAIFYFVIIKPGITLFLTIALLVCVPVAFVLVVPAPAVLRAMKRIGTWQANLAVEGLSPPQL